MDMAAAAEQAGLVEMNMAVDEAGQHGAAVDDDLGRVAHDARRDRGDPAGADADILGSVVAGDDGLAEDQIESVVGCHETAYEMWMQAVQKTCMHFMCRRSNLAEARGRKMAAIGTKLQTVETMSDAEIVRAYLEASMIPDPDGAARYMKPGAPIIFTGGRLFRPSERPDRLQREALRLGQEAHGTLRRLPRRWRDGRLQHRHAAMANGRTATPFEGNRYVDRFVVRDGLIVKMDVWNDSAERILQQRGIEA